MEAAPTAIHADPESREGVFMSVGSFEWVLQTGGVLGEEDRAALMVNLAAGYTGPQ